MYDLRTEMTLKRRARVMLEDEDKDDDDNLSNLIKESYIETRQEKSISREQLDNGEYLVDERIIEHSESHPYLDIEFKKELLNLAIVNCKPKIFATLYESLLSDCKGNFCLNDEQLSQMENIIKGNTEAEVLLKIRNYEIKYVFEKPPIDIKKLKRISEVFPDKYSFSARVDAIEPLIKQLSSLHDAADNGKKAGAKEMREIEITLKNGIQDYLKGGDGGKIISSMIQSISGSLKKLEENSSNAHLVKNVLLCLSLIGPLVKKVATGSCFFSEARASKENKDRCRGIKASLNDIKMNEENHVISKTHTNLP
ncbi:hypothetical protein Lgra_1184 [Legionella gratiana]|uniref:Uncharacterized protein n=2 Tax=Legionella gratiana TaxID=45066 RepID=A0A378J1E1_9GAMM|nr:hypothetical protein [Legionella gratiana]KTD11726.1 hypothetical protein Lgra_1184 [Legionella gratiana]STX40781.1 Uncharacterised protein [Legionella gratiana]